jgi:hypothetical protein
VHWDNRQPRGRKPLICLVSILRSCREKVFVSSLPLFLLWRKDAGVKRVGRIFSPVCLLARRCWYFFTCQLDVAIIVIFLLQFFMSNLAYVPGICRGWRSKRVWWVGKCIYVYKYLWSVYRCPRLYSYWIVLSPSKPLALQVKRHGRLARAWIYKRPYRAVVLSLMEHRHMRDYRTMIELRKSMPRSERLLGKTSGDAY